MKYILFILVAMVLYLGVQKQIDSKRIDNLQSALTLTQSENKAYRKKIEDYNEKSMEANKQIGKLRQEIQKNKEDGTDSDRCLSVDLPDYVTKFLHNK